MKTLIKFILVAVLGGAFSAAAVAGPGPQFWNRPTAKPAAPVSVQQTPALPSGLICVRMLAPNPGFSKGPQNRSVACTAEMMKNDWRCQQACANAKKG